jgi:hypothetical protein
MRRDGVEVKEVEIGCDNNQLWIFLFVYFQLVFIFIYHLFGVEGFLGYYFLKILFFNYSGHFSPPRKE